MPTQREGLRYSLELIDRKIELLNLVAENEQPVFELLIEVPLIYFRRMRKNIEAELDKLGSDPLEN